MKRVSSVWRWPSGVPEAPGKLLTMLCCPRQIDDPLWSITSPQTAGAGAAVGTQVPRRDYGDTVAKGEGFLWCYCLLSCHKLMFHQNCHPPRRPCHPPCPQESLEHYPPSGRLHPNVLGDLDSGLSDHPFHSRLNPALRGQLQARVMAKGYRASVSLLEKPEGPEG